MAVFGKKTALAELSFRLGELSTEVEQLKTKHKHLELEWEELYDKVRHQMSRMSRRAKADAKANGEAPDITPDNETSSGIDPISRSIMMRRARQVRSE